MQPGHLPEGTSNRATRAASLGLAGVVLCFAAFSILAAYTTQTQADQAQRYEALHETYAAAILAIGHEERSDMEFQLDFSPDNEATLSAATQAVVDAVNQIAARGGPEDAQLAKETLALQDRYFTAIERMSSALATGDKAEALRIDQQEADPVLDTMRDLIGDSTELREVEADSALTGLRSTARWTLILAPIVFAIGFALLFGLWRILERYHRATRETYREIEQLSRLRGEFVSTVSHEFRTPLTGIQGFSEMMRDEELTIPEMREYAGDINKDAQRLARLISDMLDLDRMESGLMAPTFLPVDLNQVVVDAAAQFRLSAARHPIELDLDERLPKLLGDPDRMTQVVTNLLSNAIKYSPSGGAIEIRTTSDERTLMLTIRDHGIGIPAEQLEKIFERYARIETKATQSIQGTGLGLPIVRQIVQLYEGKVWATSEVGEGSVLHVTLPLPTSSTLPQSAEPTRPRVRAA